MKRSRYGAAAFAACIVLALSAASCASGGKNGKPGSLRALAAKKGITVGCNIEFTHLTNKPYTEFVAGEFAALTPDNQMKWSYIHPQKDRFEWFFTDGILDFAKKNNQKVRGHVLIWHQQLSSWVSEEAKTKEKLLAIVKDHCYGIVSHYKGRIYKWDVLNEIIDDSAKLRDTVFSFRSGADFIETALRASREADPVALLYINDYSIEGVNAKSTAYYELCKDLLARGVPLDGIGFQAHWELYNMPPLESVRENVERFAALGLRVDFTELDIRIEGAPTPEDLALQAEVYAGVMKVVMETDGTDTIVFWGPDDSRSWIPRWRSSWGSATMFNRDMSPKPAYEAVKAVLRGN
jgi:endo-1,4-beta-xylanase